MKGIGTPQEEQQSQLTWTLRVLRDSTTNQRIYMAEPRPPCIYVAHMRLGLHVVPNNWSRGYPKRCCLMWDMFILAGLPCLASEEYS